MFGIAKPIPFKFDVTTYKTAGNSFPPLFFFSLQDLLNSEHVTKGNRPQVFPVWQLSYLTITQSTEGPDIDAKMFKSN